MSVATRLIDKIKLSNVKVLTASGSWTMVNEGVLVVNKTVGAATAVTGPSGSETGDFLFIKDGKGDAATNNITITMAASKTIDGAATYVISENYGAVLLFYNGTEWEVVGQTNSVSAAELAFLNGVTAGAGAASKAVVLSATQGITGLLQKSTQAAAITTTRVLTIDDSGGVFSVAKTSAYAITLPTPAQGMRFKFLVLDTGANIVTISDGAAHLNGIVSVNSVNTVMTGTTLSLASGGALGDWVEFVGIDATHYLVTGACLNAADITIA